MEELDGSRVEPERVMRPFPNLLPKKVDILLKSRGAIIFNAFSDKIYT